MQDELVRKLLLSTSFLHLFFAQRHRHTHPARPHSRNDDTLYRASTEHINCTQINIHFYWPAKGWDYFVSEFELTWLSADFRTVNRSGNMLRNSARIARLSGVDEKNIRWARARRYTIWKNWSFWHFGWRKQSLESHALQHTNSKANALRSVYLFQPRRTKKKNGNNSYNCGCRMACRV